MRQYVTRGGWRKSVKDLTRKSSRSLVSSTFFLRLPFFHNPLLLFPDSSTRAVVSPACLSRMLTVIRSRIISVIIAQPDAGSVAYIFSIYNQWLLLFPPLLWMILFCFRRSLTISFRSRTICNLCASDFSKYLFKVVKCETQFVHVVFCLRSFDLYSHSASIFEFANFRFPIFANLLNSTWFKSEEWV